MENKAKARTAASTPLYQASELLQAILSGHGAADKQMETYFRHHPQMGVRDRGLVAELVYGCLRRRRFLEYLLGSIPTQPQMLIAAYLVVINGWSARALSDAGFKGDASVLVQQLRTQDRSSLPWEAQTNLPDWLSQRLITQLGTDETLALALALNQPAPLDIRVNTQKTGREKLQSRLAEEGFPMDPTPFSAVGLRRNQRAPLFNTASFKEGWFEVQDEGSQLLAVLLEPRRGERVADFCAGAGGKTLHLGALMGNTGTIYAFDILSKRLEQLKPRLVRAGLDNVRIQLIEHERDRRLQRLRGKIDRVLVDAPCSGTGTLRRNPDIKWRTNANDMETKLVELVTIQNRILAAAAELPKPGGRVVYATCSLLREENEEVVNHFLAHHADYKQIPVAEILARRQVSLKNLDLGLRLFPHRHNTDGFYAAVLGRAV